LPERDFDCHVDRSVTLNGYSQVEFETNRYSVPADKARKNLLLKAYPFRVDILDQKEVIASHPRCYERKRDVLDPLHYLPLLEERPGAFATPSRSDAGVRHGRRSTKRSSAVCANSGPMAEACGSSYAS
jgi:hypothetical protein